MDYSERKDYRHVKRKPDVIQGAEAKTRGIFQNEVGNNETGKTCPKSLHEGEKEKRAGAGRKPAT